MSVFPFTFLYNFVPIWKVHLMHTGGIQVKEIIKAFIGLARINSVSVHKTSGGMNSLFPCWGKTNGVFSPTPIHLWQGYTNPATIPRLISCMQQWAIILASFGGGVYGKSPGFLMMTIRDGSGPGKSGYSSKPVPFGSGMDYTYWTVDIYGDTRINPHGDGDGDRLTLTPAPYPPRPIPVTRQINK